MVAQVINHTYRVAEGGEDYIAVPLDAELTDLVRRAAVEFIEANGEEAVVLRSCWECNGAHVHFIPKTDDFVLNCFGCGKWYFKQTDITIYDEEESNDGQEQVEEHSTEEG